MCMVTMTNGVTEALARTRAMNIFWFAGICLCFLAYYFFIFGKLSISGVPKCSACLSIRLGFVASECGKPSSCQDVPSPGWTSNAWKLVAKTVQRIQDQHHHVQHHFASSFGGVCLNGLQNMAILSDDQTRSMSCTRKDCDKQTPSFHPNVFHKSGNMNDHDC